MRELEGGEERSGGGRVFPAVTSADKVDACIEPYAVNGLKSAAKVVDGKKS